MLEIIDRLYAHSRDGFDPTAMDDAATCIRRAFDALEQIAAAALRNNGPLASDHDDATLRMIGECAEAARRAAGWSGANTAPPR